MFLFAFFLFLIPPILVEIVGIPGVILIWIVLFSGSALMKITGVV